MDVVDWETQRYGYHEDTSAATTAQTAQEYYGLSSSLTNEVSTECIKYFISRGRPVVIPVYGKYLNPHYTSGGPLYPMILIVGYDQDEFITHDPGTSFGEYYHYDQNKVYEAIHDLMSPESQTSSGPKTMLIFGQE